MQSCWRDSSENTPEYERRGAWPGDEPDGRFAHARSAWRYRIATKATKVTRRTNTANHDGARPAYAKATAGRRRSTDSVPCPSCCTSGRRAGFSRLRTVVLLARRQCISKPALATQHLVGYDRQR